jgi:hypothetical protein
MTLALVLTGNLGIINIKAQILFMKGHWGGELGHQKTLSFT